MYRGVAEKTEYIFRNILDLFQSSISSCSGSLTSGIVSYLPMDSGKSCSNYQVICCSFQYQPKITPYIEKKIYQYSATRVSKRLNYWLDWVVEKFVEKIFLADELVFCWVFEDMEQSYSKLILLFAVLNCRELPIFSKFHWLCINFRHCLRHDHINPLVTDPLYLVYIMAVYPPTSWYRR